MLVFKSYLSYLLYLVQLFASTVEMQVVRPVEEVESEEGDRIGELCQVFDSVGQPLSEGGFLDLQDISV